MQGAVLLGSSDEVVRSAIIWCDQRSEAQSNEPSELFGRGHEVEIVAEEGPACGAAILAGIGAAASNSVDEACDRVV
jgi:sugar (pentulose or hexulose) kinase